MVVPTDIPSTITLTGESPGNRWGPGIALHAQSGLTDFSGFTAPLWRIFGSMPGPLPAPTINVWDFPWQSPSQLLVLDVGQNTAQNAYTIAAPTDTAVGLTAQLYSNPSTHVESGTGSVQWDAQSGITAVIQAHGGSGSGLTDTQAQQLQEVHAATAPLVSLDGLTLTAMPTVPAGGTSTQNLTTPIFGVIVRITGFPPELVPSTPDGLYWLQSLAVCRIYRGSDLWLRVPIHTESKIINLEGEGLAVAVIEALTNLWLLQLSVQVSFREGVTGEAFLMNFP